MRNWLLKARKEKNLTQREVAEALDISESYYSFIESGDRQKKMDIALASRLSSVLNIPFSRIVELEDEQ